MASTITSTEAGNARIRQILGTADLDPGISLDRLTVDGSSDIGDLTPDAPQAGQYFRVGIVTNNHTSGSADGPLSKLHAPTLSVNSATADNSRETYQISGSRIIINQQIIRLPSSFSLFA